MESELTEEDYDKPFALAVMTVKDGKETVDVYPDMTLNNLADTFLPSPEGQEEEEEEEEGEEGEEEGGEEEEEGHTMEGANPKPEEEKITGDLAPLPSLMMPITGIDPCEVEERSESSSSSSDSDL